MASRAVKAGCLPADRLDQSGNSGVSDGQVGDGHRWLGEGEGRDKGGGGGRVHLGHLRLKHPAPNLASLSSRCLE